MISGPIDDGEWNPTDDNAPDAVPVEQTTNVRRLKTTTSPSPDTRPDRPQVALGSDLSRIVDETIEALAPCDIYQRGGMLADVVRDAPRRGERIVRPDGAPTIRVLPRARLRELMTDAIDYRKQYKKTAKDKTVTYEWGSAPPPIDVVTTTEARGQWAHIRPLVGISEWPVMRPDGTILTEPGYDHATGLLYTPTCGKVTVPTVPTEMDVRAAVKALNDLVCDFPFVGGPHRSAWLACLLTSLARPAIDGPTPLTINEANERGSGKSMLADIVGTILTGKMLPRRTVPKSPEEWGKAILSVALAGDQVLLFDNITSNLQSDDLDAVLTGTSYRQRLLGSNVERVLPWRTVLIATANNAAISTDLVRRSILCRIETGESPEMRSGPVEGKTWTIPNILQHVRDNRERYLAAGLTILRHAVVCGPPKVKMRPMGSYDAWSSVVRSALLWAGMDDPVLTQDELREGADPERDALGSLLVAWHERFGSQHVTVQKALDELSSRMASDLPLVNAITELCGIVPGKPELPKALGFKLRSAKGCTVGGLRLVSAAKTNNGVPWYVESRDPGHR